MSRDADTPCPVIITTRLSNGEIRHATFDLATVHVKQGFIIVHHEEKESGAQREDWFAVGTVVRVEIRRAAD